MSFAHALAEAAKAIEARLIAACAALPGSTVAEAMAYACRGGKKLRGFLVMEGARLHGVAPGAALEAAAAIEALHAYSLVHDDLPCMDDDDMRRGQPTVHRVWDEATAVLAGDALLTMAFGLVSAPGPIESPAIRADLAATLAQAAGAQGMVLGQAQDIAAQTAAAPLDLAAITTLQANKTGALIRWAGEAGARLAGADPRALGSYAAALGLAFQVADDILDVTGDAAAAGKRVGKDAEAGKATFVGLLGLAEARARAQALVRAAEDALAPYGPEAEILRDAARFAISRRY